MKKLFKNKTLIVTGMGRSGTTLLGKIIGSMHQTFYLFEPAINKYIASFPYSDIFTKILFEDYFLPLVHGRGNSNPHDWSYMGRYEPIFDIYYRQRRLRRRSDALKWIEEHKPLWVIKSPEFQHLMEYAHAHFPGVRYIHIIRNGLDVVRSSMERGWYTNDYCNNDIVEETYGPVGSGNVRIPHFIEDAMDREYWQQWMPLTRAACSWRHLTLQGLRYKKRNADSVFQFRYEDFCKQPKKFAKHLADKLNLSITKLTKQHIGEVFSKPADDMKIPVHHIEQPEKDKFIKLNERLGYDI